MDIIPVGLGFVIEPSEVKGLGFDFRGDSIPLAGQTIVDGKNFRFRKPSNFV
jgi:hypothetical protein